MSSETTHRSWLGVVRSYPGDLLACTAITVGCWYAVTSLPPGSRLRIAATVPLLLALPGYAVVSILFPGAAQRRPTQRETPRQARGIDLAERLGLSFGISIALLPVVSTLIVLVGFDLSATSATTAIGGLTVVAAQAGAWRRSRVPIADRFVLSPVDQFRRLTGEDARYATATAGVLVGAVVLSVGVLLFAIASPPAAASYTEIALYGEDSDGEYEIGAIPAAIEPNGSVSVGVEVTNNHDETRPYTAVIQQQTVDDGEVIDRTESTRLEYQVDPSSSSIEDATIAPQAPLDEPVRIVVLLYETDDGVVPDEPTLDNADQSLYFWITLTEDPDDDGTIVVD
ncbi:DUF1616 domain-containing protein [Halovivax gelatinilyticus]|uniref:DUF1616 domain-containing protein n=1 Tax=Halovivax gelatinilyticus TaxID=2961597 RepID=UPI0020CA73D1|nr:DUF1616 domain-containing protein [Halovivax gelatinilyticus]